jgi:hypothetical protein
MDGTDPVTGAPTKMFLNIPASGAAGNATALPNFLGISSGPRLRGLAANCAVANNHYCH